MRASKHACRLQIEEPGLCRRRRGDDHLRERARIARVDGDLRLPLQDFNELIVADPWLAVRPRAVDPREHWPGPAVVARAILNPHMLPVIGVAAFGPAFHLV